MKSPRTNTSARVLRTMQQLGVKVPIIMPRVGLIETTRKLAGEAADGARENAIWRNYSA